MYIVGEAPCWIAYTQASTPEGRKQAEQLNKIVTRYLQAKSIRQNSKRILDVAEKTFGSDTVSHIFSRGRSQAIQQSFIEKRDAITEKLNDPSMSLKIN